MLAFSVTSKDLRLASKVALPLLFLTLSFAEPATNVPIQALLVRTMEAGRVKTGDAVFAKVAVEWSSPQCRLRKGAVLKGRVVSESAHSKTAKTSEISLLFESGECGGRDMKPLPLTVAAVVGPTPTRDEGLYESEQTQLLSEVPGLGIGTATPVTPALGGSSGGGFRSVQGAAATAFVMPSRPKRPKAVMPGQVVGISGLKLSVGTGPEGSSILSDAKHNVRLDADSQLVLVPRPNAVAPTATTTSAIPPRPATLSSSSALPASPVADQNPMLDETEVCLPPQCSDLLPLGEVDTKAAKAAGVLSVKGLGYPARPTREMFSFDEDAAIAYLGPKELLFTFNPHRLVPRNGPETGADATRVIRGVLINLTTMKSGKVVDWRVADNHRYLWPIGHDHVLIHSGNEVRLYGPGLKLEQRVPLQGPLAFLRISPSGAYLAIGVVQERHSAATHRQLAEAENRDPEEDVDVTVLDQNFRKLTSVIRSSRDAAPVLTDAGEVRIPTIGKNRWRIVEYSWDKQRRVVAQVTSVCVPQATSLPPNLLFVIGCNAMGSGKWYRMLAPNGKPVLKGWSPAAELEQTARGSAGSDVFVVRVAKATSSLAADSVFHASDLVSEYIAVYDAGNGRRLFGVTIPSPVPTQQTFALSPAGNQLTVLTEGQLVFYAVPAASEARNRE